MTQRTPIWPYVLVLGCLFGLALVAPRVWDHFGQGETVKPVAAIETQPRIASSTVVGAALVLPAQVQTAGFLAPTDSGSDLPKSAARSENASDALIDHWQNDAAAELKTGHESAQEPVRLSEDPAKDSQPSFGATGGAAGTVAPTALLAANAPAPSTAVAEPTGPVIEIPAPPVLNLHRDMSAVGATLASEFSRTLHALAIHPNPKRLPVETAPASAPATTELVNSSTSKAPSPASQLLQSGNGGAASHLLSATPKPSNNKAAIGAAIATDLPTGVVAAPAPQAWPLPKGLLDSLHGLSQQDDAAVRGWVADVDGQIEELHRLQPRDIHQAAAVLNELRRLTEQGATLAATNPQLASDISRVRYAIVRRLDVWEIVCNQRRAAIVSTAQATLNRRQMELCLADVNSMAEQSGTATGLREHLMLDALGELAQRDDEAAADQRRHLAREVLGRIADRRQANGRPVLTEQRSLAALDKQLRQWVSAPTEGEELLNLVERFESDGRADDARRLAELSSQLLRSTTADDNELGRRLETHYRNANLRIALNSQLINRFLPEQKTVESPVDDTILGTPVRGRSTTSTELRVRLLPNPRAWQIAIEAAGSVDSQTSSTYGPVTFLNQGAAQFLVHKQISIDAAGIHAEPAGAEVDSNSSVAGIRTHYDAIPVMRSIVKNYAMSQRQQKVGQANQEAEEKIRQAACERVDSQVGPRLTQVEQNFRDRLLAPLEKLGVNPTIATLETSETRLTVRSRLAGNDQLAAHTPRPDAPAESLASMQVHESAVNNLLDHLDLAGRTFTLPELHRQLNEKLSRVGKPLPEDLPAGVEVTFAKTAPLQVRCREGRVELVLNIAEIRQGKRHWRDFEVRAGFRPKVHGLAADFERDGSVELGGQYKGKTEVALRGIFSKVLSRDRKITLLPSMVTDDPRMANLQVTQLVVVDGWIGLAIGPDPAVARQPSGVKQF